jgi:hypothetical protein
LLSRRDTLGLPAIRKVQNFLQRSITVQEVIEADHSGQFFRVMIATAEHL